MTILMPKKTIGDKILKALGKNRGVILPTPKQMQKFGIHAQYMAKEENFFKALFRSKNAKLPDGMVDIDQYKDNKL